MRSPIVLGRRRVGLLGWGPRVRLRGAGSLLVVGPTQGGKTSSLVVPALLSWPHAAVVTSVKSDVVAATRSWRATLGRVQVLEPGRETGLTWDPLEGVTSLPSAARAAGALVSRSGAHADSDFWNALATKLLAGLFVRCRERAGTISDVVEVVESRRLERWLDPPSPSTRLIEDFLRHEARTLDGVLTTIETMLVPWRFEQPLARVTGVLDGPNTLYLVAPRAHQRHYEGLLRGALGTVLEAQQARVESGRGGPLLLVLDEAALVAPLEDLDELAASLAGLGVTLVSVVQDFAQLRARWGTRAATIVNNHATRLVLAGLSDPEVSRFLPEVNEAHAVPLRQRPRGTATLIAGSYPARTIALRPWWRQRRLRRRGERPLGTMPR